MVTGIHGFTHSKTVFIKIFEILVILSERLLLLFRRARWLMSPDVPQPVRLIVLTLL
jgi:hypothetical protein